MWKEYHSTDHTYNFRYLVRHPHFWVSVCRKYSALAGAINEYYEWKPMDSWKGIFNALHIWHTLICFSHASKQASYGCMCIGILIQINIHTNVYRYSESARTTFKREDCN